MNRKVNKNDNGKIEVSFMWEGDAYNQEYIPLPCVRFIYYMGIKYPEYYNGRTTMGGEESRAE